jgi:UDP-N-acetylglucosamine acyltransferase
MSIHPTAVVAKEAVIDPSATIGPFCLVGPHVQIGADTELCSHVVVQNRTTLGARNVVHPFACLGGVPQDLKYKGAPAVLTIGDDNVIRENATLSIGTQATMETRVGSRCLLMANSHVAHDCQLGDQVILVNSVGLAGHVHVGSNVTLGGLSAVHQFCRIGRHAFIAGGGMVAQDVPPFCIAQGDRAELVGINIIGLRRAGWSRERIAAVREGFRALFQSGPTRMMAVTRVAEELEHSDQADVREMLEFVRQSKRGVCPPRVVLPAADDYCADGGGAP